MRLDRPRLPLDSSVLSDSTFAHPDYAQLQQAVARCGCYNIVPRSWLFSLGPTASILLSHLLGVAKSSAEAGWIPAGELYLQRGLNLKPERQSVLLGLLADRGLITVSGDGGRRRVLLNGEEILRMTKQRLAA